MFFGLIIVYSMAFILSFKYKSDQGLIFILSGMPFIILFTVISLYFFNIINFIIPVCVAVVMLAFQLVLHSFSITYQIENYRKQNTINLEKMKSELKDGKKPYKLQLVGLEIGGKPIEE